MKESENASYNEEPDVWKYIENNPRIMGLPLSDDKAIDICSALRDVYMTLQENTEAGIDTTQPASHSSSRCSRRSGQ
jgi:hypothetical protein